MIASNLRPKEECYTSGETWRRKKEEEKAKEREGQREVEEKRRLG